MVGQSLRRGVNDPILGTQFFVRNKNAYRKPLLALLLVGPLVAGCSGGSLSDMFSSDLLSKDAEWFSRTGRLSISNVSIETPPLTPNKPVTSEDLVSAEGYCAGMAPPAGANALTEGAAGAPPQPSTSGTVALGHTECDVVRGIGAPGNVSLSNNGRGDRVAVITYTQGQRAGIYTFVAGRLTSIERGPQAEVQPKPVKPKKKKPAAT
jgi:hypothetical protein